MCGICGTISFTDEVNETCVRRMVASLRHRGPDAEGVFVGPHVGLGHARLSIIDLTSTGCQPMADVTGRFVLVYNGEVYNYQELRTELERTGAIFRGTSDTEVVLALCQREGVSALPKLNGMFALALWDRHEERLLLARDRLGIKPLYYEVSGSTIRFASEAKALLLGRPGRAVSWQALHEFLWFGNAIGPQTIFEGIRKLPPGHYLTFDRRGIQTQPYWRIEDVGGIGRTDHAAIRDALADAVRRQLRADVPVGIFLSGGIDSSALTALAVPQYPGQLRTFSVGFDDSSQESELPLAKRVARHFGTLHEELHVTPADARPAVERLVRAHDEPFGDAANIPLYLLAEQLRGSIKVVLQGDGGDELFGGYRRYSLLRYPAFWALITRVGKVLLTGNSHPIAARVRRLSDALTQPSDWGRMALLLTTETSARLPTCLLTDEAREQIQMRSPFAEYVRCSDRWPEESPLQRMLYTDLTILLPYTFLEKVDRSTMAHGLESRVPFLDSNIVELALATPGHRKLPLGRKKGMLKASLRGTLPSWVLNAPKKGFGVPVSRWLRQSLLSFAREVLGDPSVDASGLISRSKALDCLERHADGRTEAGVLLWKYFQLALWQSEYLRAA